MTLPAEPRNAAYARNHFPIGRKDMTDEKIVARTLSEYERGVLAGLEQAQKYVSDAAPHGQYESFNEHYVYRKLREAITKLRSTS